MQTQCLVSTTEIKPLMEGRYYSCEHPNGTVQLINYSQPVGIRWLAAFIIRDEQQLFPWHILDGQNSHAKNESKTTLHGTRAGERAEEETLLVSLPDSNSDSYLAKSTAPTCPGLPAATTISDHGAIL